MVRKCGYVSNRKDGSERLNLTAFCWGGPYSHMGTKA
jgi:hypothetical protein